MTTLEELHAAITASIGIDDRYVVIDRGPHYVQLLFDECDGVVAEVVSNNFLEGEAVLWPAQEEQLSARGWRAPVEKCDDDTCTEGTHPNWWRYVAAPVDAGALTALAADTMMSVFHVDLPAVGLDVQQLS